MINIKSEWERDIMRTCAHVTGEILRDLAGYIEPGMSTLDINQFVENRIRKAKMTPSFLGLYDFPASACISVNEEVVHGIPRADRILKEGDIVSVDTGATYKGYVSDAARTYPVGEVSQVAKDLMAAAEKGFFAAIEFAKPGFRVSDISHAVQETVEAEGFGIVRELVGHGVGRVMHEDPQIPNYGKAGRGPRIAKGMVFAIEPMITEGDYAVEVLEDEWTYVTKDRKLSAHYENTVVITDGEPELLTYVE